MSEYQVNTAVIILRSKLQNAYFTEVNMLIQQTEVIPFLAEPDMPCLSKQCRSDLHCLSLNVNFYQKPRSSNSTGWKLEVGMAS